MSTDLMPFDFDGCEIRVLTVEGEPWFVAGDVARILGFQDAYYLTRGLDNYDKVPRIVGTPGGDQEMTTISEAGLYSAILRSRVEGARRFKHWVTHDVLPSIRRTGAYSTVPALTEDQIIAQALQITTRRVEALESRVAELTPPAQAWEHLASTDGDLSCNDAAKIISRDPAITIGEGRLWKWLDQNGWTYRDPSGDRRAYQRYIESGHLTARARGHHHPGTGEWVVDAPQIRFTMRGIELIRRRLVGTSGQLALVAS